MHCLITLFLGVIALAIILLVIGLVALCVLIVALTTIMASIVLMTMVRSAIVTIASVALMVITVLVTAMMTVAQFTATRGRKMSYFTFLWLLLVLGNLLKNASRLVSRLTLLKESNHSEQVGRHCLVQVGKLVLVCLRLCKEDLFTLLLRRGYVHCLAEVVTLKVAEKLHSTPGELMYLHEYGLLGCTKPANQLVANVGKPGNGLKVVPDALDKVCLCMICIVWVSLRNNTGPLGQAYILKALTQEAKQQWTIVLLHIQ
jgi:hypothetical protein